MGKLCDMFNDVNREHRKFNAACEGNFNFDYSAEEQRGLCWCEKVICDACKYKSQKYKLYTEVATQNKGRKAATANIGLNIGLTQNPIGPSSVRKLCLSSNIPAPSKCGMTKCAIKVCKGIETANISDMRSRWTKLKNINRIRRRPENEIAVQSDGIIIIIYMLV